MKPLTTIILLSITTFAHAQGIHSTTEAQNYVNTLERQVMTNNAGADSMLVSYQALNVFFAKKVNTYLTAIGDLSLFNRYAVINSADKRLFIGQNFAKKPWANEERTKHIFTVGLEAKAEDNFSELYSGNNFSSDIGASLKYTWLGRGVLK